MAVQFSAPQKPFRLEEATIEELHAAIKSGQTTCVAIVQHYIDRVRAYNGVASVLVTPDGAPIPEAAGAVRAQAPLRFPTATGGGDARYDIDFPARDHVLVEQLRHKGAIIFAKAVNTEYNGRAGDPGGRHTPAQVLPSTLGYQRSTWGGNPANPYDTHGRPRSARARGCRSVPIW
jgi:hypothetical protein